MAATKEAIESALERGHSIDITTKGRQSGKPRRLEIVFHNIDGRIYISGIPFPNRRSWLANLDADPPHDISSERQGPSRPTGDRARHRG